MRRRARPQSTSPSRLAASRAQLTEILHESRRLGLLGPGDVGPHVDHGVAFGEALLDGRDDALLVADLGSGGGIPALPMACRFERMRFVLIDAAAKRTAFLVWAVVQLALQERVTVVRGRAEELGHDPEHRFAYDGVVARSFGPPSSTLECAAPLLRPGGRCVISEPPGGRSWPADELATLGLTSYPGATGYAIFERTGVVGEDYPRPRRAQRARPVVTPDGGVSGSSSG